MTYLLSCKHCLEKIADELYLFFSIQMFQPGKARRQPQAR